MYKRGGCTHIVKMYNICEDTFYKWIMKDRIQGNQINNIEHKRNRLKEKNIGCKEIKKCQNS